MVYLLWLLVATTVANGNQHNSNLSYEAAGPPNGSVELEPTADPREEEYRILRMHLQRTRFIVQKILVPLVVTFGVVGNFVNIAVLTQKVMRTSSTNWYLTALAICDVMYLLLGVTLGLKHYESIKTADLYIRYRLPIGKPLADTFSNTGVWLTLTFTLERWFGVAYPMKGKVWCTPQRARFIILVVSCIAFIITFPEFFERKVLSIIDDATNTTKLKVTYTALGKAHAYKWGYVYMNQALFTLIPLLLLLIFNTLLIRTVIQASRNRKAMAKLSVSSQNDRQEKQSRENHKITVMLISVVIVFLLCQLPQAIQNLYITYLQVTDTLTLRHQLILTITANVFNLLVQVNSSANFILYSCFSMKFRRTFRRLFCRCWVKPTDKTHMFSETSNNENKTHLILHCTHNNTTTTTTTTSTSPKRSPLLNIHNAQGQDKVKTKNGYLEVSTGKRGSFV